MAIAVLQNVGTVLRHTNAALQEIDPVDGEDPPIDKVQEKVTEVVAALDKLGIGSPPIPEGVDVFPDAAFMALSKSVVADAFARLGSVSKTDLPVQFDDIQQLRARIDELSKRLAVAIIRKP